MYLHQVGNCNNICACKELHMNIYNKISHNSQKVKVAPTTVYLFHGILCSNERESSTDTCCSL